jgi:roadblock/LC7 domain-containing protein
METTADAITKAKTNLDAFTSLPEMDELTMIEYNLAASKYSTMVSLSSGLVKNLSDTEKQVANKM